VLATLRARLAQLAGAATLPPGAEPAAVAALLAAALDGLLLQRVADPTTDLPAAGRALAALLGAGNASQSEGCTS
jgi:hypothetical protein